MLKILKLTVPTNPKVTSFIAKFALHCTLYNKTPTKEEIGFCIGLCLNHKDLRDKFCGINEELAQLGYKRVEVLNNALRYCKYDGKNNNNNVVYVPITYEPETYRQERRRDTVYIDRIMSILYDQQVKN